MEKKTKTSYGLTGRCKRLLRLLAEKLGVSQTDVIEMSVRMMAEKEGIHDTNTDIPLPPAQD
jgi:hypothetical protein